MWRRWTTCYTKVFNKFRPELDDFTSLRQVEDDALGVGDMEGFEL